MKKKNRLFYVILEAVVQSLMNIGQFFVTKIAFLVTGLNTFMDSPWRIPNFPRVLSRLKLMIIMLLKLCDVIQCLKLSPKALGKTSTGQVVNLLANDIAIFETCSLYFSILWTGPLLVLASIVIMCFYFGIYAFVIIAILVLLIPIQRETMNIDK